jgi:type I restriction enzyme S subunit
MDSATTHIETENNKPVLSDRRRVPALRFKEFEEKWDSQLLGNIVSKVGSGSTPSGGVQVYQKTGIPFIRSQNVTGNELVLDETHISESINLKMKGSIVKPHDILLNITGGSIGRTCVVPSNFDIGNVNQHVCIIRLKSDYTPKFLQPFLASHKGQKLLYQGMTGSGREGINFQSIRLFKLKLPALLEQQKIASFLSAVDDKVQQLTKKKALLEDYKKGVMQQLFTGQLRFKAEDGKDYPDWEEKRLGEVGKIVSGLTYSPDDKNEEGVLVLRSSNVHSRKVTYTDNVFVNVEEGGFNPLEENDILICVRNGSKRLIGKNALISGKAIGVAFGAFMTVYRSESNLFLFHYFDSVDYKKEVYKNLGATINSINGSDLKKFKIPFPSHPEQQKIATYLSGIDTKIESVNTQITQTQTFKKGLLQQMFV